MMRRTLAWLVLAAALSWAVAVVGSPRALVGEAGRAGRTVAAAVYVGASFLCHQRPERSFWADDRPYPVCARCTGLYLGAPLGLALVLWLSRRGRGSSGAWWGGRARFDAERSGRDAEIAAAGRTYTWWQLALVLAALPTVGSVAVERLFGLSCNISRAVTALPLGAAVAALVGALLLGSGGAVGGSRRRLVSAPSRTVRYTNHS